VARRSICVTKRHFPVISIAVFAVYLPAGYFFWEETGTWNDVIRELLWHAPSWTAMDILLSKY
jgi:hypothetical protein